MRGRKRAFALKLMEVILDVSGASGHVNAYCAAQMTEPVFRTYLTVHEALLDIIEKRIIPQQGYDCILLSREKLLRDNRFRKRLSINAPADRALCRLLAMGRVVDVERADCFVQVFEDLAPGPRRSLVDALNADGVDGQSAILFSYVPALISNTLNTAEGAEHQVLTLGALMRFLARMFDDGSVFRHWQGSNIREINLSFAQESICSDEFRKDPGFIDGLPIPPHI